MLSIRPKELASSAEHPGRMKSENRGPKFEDGEEREKGPQVLYRFLKMDEDGIVVENIESDKPIPIGKSTATESLTSQTILEVLTTLHQRTKITYTVLKVHSTHLVNVLRDVIVYWPGMGFVSTKTKPVQISYPFAPLVVFRQEIENYKTNHPAAHSRDYIEQCNAHIDVLLKFLDEVMGDEVLAEKALHSKSPAMATYKNLWMLFRPGQVVYIHESNNEPAIPMVVGNIRAVEEIAPDRRGLSEKFTGIEGWCVQNDGLNFKPAFMSVGIDFFEGERHIHTLAAYPKEYHESRQYEQYLEERGKRYWEFAEPTYIHYDGPILQSTYDDSYSNRHTYKPRTIPRVRVAGNLNERVVLDFRSWSENRSKDSHYKNSAPEPSLPEHWSQVPSAKGCECETCMATPSIARRSPLFDAIDVRDAAGPGNKFLYSLSDYIVYGFILRENKWAMFHIDHVKRIGFKKDPFQHLILPPRIKDTITSIVWNYSQKDGSLSSWSPDFVKSKGEGQIFLLHGTPGVGKTCTAECVADYMTKPLLPISCADIGIGAEEVQKNISRYFRLGKQWGAVVLIDEADVYLEQRSPEQLERNSLVSVFLKELEYFQGLLFITTNRVGTFDDAFISRIHVALYYPALVDSDRVKIWKTNFRRLEDESKVEVAKATRHFVEDDEELRMAKWNGREIRNALQTALALAKKEADNLGNPTVILRPEHIERVVEISRSFKKYIHAVHEDDEAGRAKRKEVRADDFDILKSDG